MCMKNIVVTVHIKQKKVCMKNISIFGEQNNYSVQYKELLLLEVYYDLRKIPTKISLWIKIVAGKSILIIMSTLSIAQSNG